MLLHVIPRAVLSNKYHGAYKDAISRVRWFQAQQEEFFQLEISEDREDAICGLPAVQGVRGILVEYTLYPNVVAALRRRYPDAFLAVRAINIEPLQHFDNCGWWPARGPLWMLYGMWRLFRQDMRCKRLADVIYSINDYENRIYWNRLPGRARVEWLPYFCPDHLVPPNPMPLGDRTTIACLPTSKKNRKSWDLVTRFIRFAKAAKAAGSRLDFIITGHVSDWGLPTSDAVAYTGMVDDLPAFLGGLRAAAVLSPLGLGLKTTILDAMAAGAHVLAHPTIVRRCPCSIAHGLISCDTAQGLSAGEIERVLSALDAPFPLPHVNREMRSQQEALLVHAFLK